MAVGAVLVGAGAGTRLGAQVPKALVRLGDRALVAHAVARLAATGVVGEIVVTAPAGFGEQVRAAARSALAGVASVVEDAGSSAAVELTLHVIEGDYPSRQASVAAGLDRLSTPDSGVVLVHDAARPLTPPATMRRLVEAIRAGHDAVVPVLPLADTIRMIDPEDPTRAQGVVDRRHLRAVQTPQAFRAQVLRQAHAENADRGQQESAAATDDAVLIEEMSVPVHLLDGDRSAMKITDRHDLAAAETLLAEGHL